MRDFRTSASVRSRMFTFARYAKCAAKDGVPTDLRSGARSGCPGKTSASSAQNRNCLPEGGLA